jgi:hypothetical protein
LRFFPYRWRLDLGQKEAGESRLLMRSFGKAGFNSAAKLKNLVGEFESKLPVSKDKTKGGNPVLFYCCLKHGCWNLI